MTFIEFVEAFCRVADRIIHSESVTSSLQTVKVTKTMPQGSNVGSPKSTKNSESLISGLGNSASKNKGSLLSQSDTKVKPSAEG